MGATRPLTSLPLELQLQIISNLPYPDTLSLKLVSRHFRALTADSLTVISRVTWLLARAEARLPIPQSSQMRLRSDGEFLQNKEVQGILRARRRHEECAKAWQALESVRDWPGCLVVPGVELCEQGLRVLERAGQSRPIRTCAGQMVFSSEGMARRAEAFRREIEEARVVRRRWYWISSWLVGIMVVVIGMVVASHKVGAAVGVS